MVNSVREEADSPGMSCSARGHGEVAIDRLPLIFHDLYMRGFVAYLSQGRMTLTSQTRIVEILRFCDFAILRLELAEAGGCCVATVARTGGVKSKYPQTENFMFK